jgi:hypothetical protein
MEVIARIPFQYGPQNVERGEVLTLKGFPRDNQLLALRYFIQYDAREHNKQPCPMCGRTFAGYSFLLGHKKKPNCLAASPEITAEETADLLGIDPKNVR